MEPYWALDMQDAAIDWSFLNPTVLDMQLDPMATLHEGPSHG